MSRRSPYRLGFVAAALLLAAIRVSADETDGATDLLSPAEVAHRSDARSSTRIALSELVTWRPSAG